MQLSRLTIAVSTTILSLGVPHPKLDQRFNEMIEAYWGRWRDSSRPAPLQGDCSERTFVYRVAHKRVVQRDRAGAGNLGKTTSAVRLTRARQTLHPSSENTERTPHDAWLYPAETDAIDDLLAI